MRDHAMIGEGDHVLAGLSGGKDSMVLLQLLAERRRSVPFDFTITAAHIAAEGIGYHIDRGHLEDFCRDLDIPLEYRIITPDLQKDPSKPVCFVCSWHRRKELFAMTREFKCNKLALGHHRMDAVETLLLNMIYHGSISSLPYTLKMFGGRVMLIRPLMDLDEKLLDEYSDLNSLVRIGKSCPHEDRTRRELIARLVAAIGELHKQGPANIFRSMGKIFDEYLPSASKSGHASGPPAGE